MVAASAQYRDKGVYADLYDSETVASLKSHVRELSAAHLEGRKAGSEGERLAAEYVTDVLKSYGVDVLSPDEGEVFGIRTEDGDTLTSRNVIGYVQGYDKKLRDRYVVVELERDYPQYQFARHKGYGTKLHYEMLDQYGPCAAHRKTFLKKWEEKKG